MYHLKKRDPDLGDKLALALADLANEATQHLADGVSHHSKFAHGIARDALAVR